MSSSTDNNNNNNNNNNHNINDNNSSSNSSCDNDNNNNNDDDDVSCSSLVDEDLSSSSSNNNNNKSDNNTTGCLTLRIKESSNSPPKQQDVIVTVQLTDTVAAVKFAVIRALQQQPPNNPHLNPNDVYVRLIASGRLLAPDSALMSQFQFSTKAVIVVHAVIVAKDQIQKQGAQALLQQSSSSSSSSQMMHRRIVRGTGIDATGWAVRRDPVDEDEEEEDEDETETETTGGDSNMLLLDLEQGQGGQQPQQSHRHITTTTTSRRQQPRIRAGFDTLRDTAGLRRSEILAIRAYFNRSIDRWLQANPAVVRFTEQQEPGDALLRRRYQEEAWMQAQGPASEFRLNLSGLQTTTPFGFDTTVAQQQQYYRNNPHHTMSSTSVGTDRDFVWGFMLGFFVGFLMLVWVWMPTVPHKQKLGILTGYSFHLALGMWKGGQEVLLQEQEDGVYEGNTNNMLLLGD